MYTAYDFINGDVEPKRIRLGWKAGTKKLLTGTALTLRYTAINFDWKSLETLGDEGWDLFLNSVSFGRLQCMLRRAMARKKRLYYEAFSIQELKDTIAEDGLRIDVDKLIRAEIRRLGEKTKKASRRKPKKNAGVSRKNP